MPNLRLQPFDRHFLMKIEGCKNLKIDKKKGVYYTIKQGKKKVGIIGFIKAKGYFLQVAIHQDYRGKGLLKKAVGLLVIKHKIDKLYATIKQSNHQSISAHRKLGFRQLPQRYLTNLKVKRLLPESCTRLVKSFA